MNEDITKKNEIPIEYLDMLPGIYYTMDIRNLVCLEISPKYNKVFGYPKDYQLTGNDLFIRKIYFEDKMKFISIAQDCENKPLEVEYRILSAQGITIPVKDIIYRPDKKTQVLRGYIIPRPREIISEKNKPHSTIDFKLALNRIQDAFFYLEPYYDAIDRIVDFTIKEVNLTAEKKLGLAKDELVGKNFFVMMTLLKDKWGEFEIFKNCFLTQKYIETEYQKLNDANRDWHYLNLIPIPTGLLVYHKEISKWKYTQTELGTTLEFLKAINNSIPALITLNEFESQEYIYINRSILQITGYSQWDFFAKGLEQFWKLVDDGDRPRIIQEFQIINKLFEDSQIEDDKKKYVIEFSIQTKSGEKKRIRSFLTLFKMDTDIQRKYVLSIGVDITQEYNSNRKLLLQDKEYQEIFSKLPDAILRFDSNFRCLFANQVASQLLGIHPDKTNIKNIYNIGLPLTIQNIFLDQMNKIQKEKKEVEILFDFPIQNKYNYYRAIFIPEFSTNKDIKNYLIKITDISKNRTNDFTILNVINHDSLTGLINRKHFLEILETSLQNLSLNEKLGILYFDINSFREVNDMLGHKIGDELLTLVAKKVSAMFEENLYFARFGGNGFAIALKGQEESFKTEIVSLAIDIMSLFTDPFIIEKNEVYVHVSIGIALYPEDGEDHIHLVANAEKATFHGKKKEENTFTFFDSSMGKESVKRRKIANDLRKGLEQDEFYLVYQPKIDLANGQIHGVETLLRWKTNPTLSPGVFVPVAEESGIINQIGEWVLSRSIRDLSGLNQKGFSINLAVNLSPKQFAIPSISKLIFDFLSMYSFPFELFEVEVTEGTAMKNISQSTSILSELNKKGIRISIDDFGTGYSSLAYLKKFPISHLKIDRTFIKDLPEDKNSISIVEAILSMSQNLGLKTIAEGVESKIQVEMLQSKGCNYIQGFYISKGLTITELEIFLTNYKGTL